MPAYFNTFSGLPNPCSTMSYSILFSCIIFMLKNCTVTCCLYCHYLGRIELILILIHILALLQTEEDRQLMEELNVMVDRLKVRGRGTILLH